MYDYAILYLAIDPNYYTALNNKGAALDNLGNYTGAILYYDKALTVNPKYEDALYNMGYDLAALGNCTVMRYTVCNILQMRQDTLIIYQPCKG